MMAWDASETQNLSDLCRFFRSRHRSTIDESGCGSLGLRHGCLQEGICEETNDPKIVAATMAKPGVLLKRPVGSNGPFGENAELPQINKVTETRAKSQPRRQEPTAYRVDDNTARDAALAFEREQKRREIIHRKEEAAREKERKRREQAIAKAERALEEANREHEAEVKKIENARAAVDQRYKAEDARWQKQKEKLETRLRRAHD